MDKAKAVRKGEALNWQQLDAYVKEQLPELQAEMSVAQFHGGHANLTYLLTFGDRELVLRRPPFGKIAPGAHDMRREYNVLSKLHHYYTPAPKAYHLCEDENIIGAKFVLLERKKGVVMRTEIPDSFTAFDDVETRLAKALVKALADLHLVDYEKAGLTELGKPEGFVERQLAGWAKRWELAQTDNNAAMDNILQWLQSDVPESNHSAIVHNDFKLDNCQFQSNDPDNITAVFDWDMCTIGDPLIDFGTTLCYWPDERKQAHKSLPINLKGNFPPKTLLIEQYQQLTGFNVDRITWHEVFSYWRVAVVLQQLYKRYVDGDSTDQRMQNMGHAAQALTEIAHSIINEV